MKLKTLLLGSAAAMIAVSGARAADAVVAEPEPVEYVKVCDMYGAGFYYIPGTETCLSFSGYVRVDYTVNDNDDPARDSTNWDYRARVNIDARNETDYGTLRSQIRLQSDGNGGHNHLAGEIIEDGSGLDVTATYLGADSAFAVSGDGIVGIDRALISLAGFRLGYSDSYTTTLHGYGNFNEKYDGYYGYDQAIFFDYTYAANGFTLTAGVQDSSGPNHSTTSSVNNNVGIDYYVGGSYTASYGTFAASYIHEDLADDGAWKVSATLNLIENLTLKGWYSADSDGTTRQVEGAGEYNWGVGARYAVNSDVALDIGYTDQDANDAGQLSVGVRWQPVPGLSIRPTAVFRENDSSSYSLRVYRNW